MARHHRPLSGSRGPAARFRSRVSSFAAGRGRRAVAAHGVGALGGATSSAARGPRPVGTPAGDRTSVAVVCGSLLAGAGTAMTVLAPSRRPETAEGSFGSALPREDPVTRLPILILYPHSRCNCRCLMCDIWRDRGREEISAAEVERWLAEWRGLGVR